MTQWGLWVCLVLVVMSTCWVVYTPAVASVPNQSVAKYQESVTGKDGKRAFFEMVLIPGGTFRMGSPADEEGRQDREGPQHHVRLDPFYLCSTETIQELFQLVPNTHY